MSPQTLIREVVENQYVHSDILEQEKILNYTQVVCPSCFRVIPAKLVERGDYVYLVKECIFEERVFESIFEKKNKIWKEVIYDDPGKRMRYEIKIGQHLNEFDYSLIANSNKSQAIFALVTQRCNANCPICFDKKWLKRPDMKKEYLRKVLKPFKYKKVYLSGGEPTVRDDLPDLLRVVKESGNYAGIVTNGLKLSDEGYLKELIDSGLEILYFSFDGFDEEIYRILRDDSSQYSKKLKALENLKKFNLNTALLVTVVKDVNDDQISKIVEFACENDFIWLVSFRYLNIYGVNDTRDLDEKNLVSIEEIMAPINHTLGINYDYYNLFYEMRYYFHEFISTIYPRINLDQPENRRVYLERKSSGVKPVFSEDELKELIDVFKRKRFYKLVKPKYLYFIKLFVKNRFELGLIEEELFRKNFFTIDITRPPLMISDHPLSGRVQDIIYFPEPLKVFCYYPY